MLLARNRNFRLLFSASAISNLGDGISALAFPWLATLITRDPLLIGTVAAATRLPWLLFALPAGVVTDRVDRQQLMVQADLLRMILTFGVVAMILAAPALPMSDGDPSVPWMIAGLCAAAFLLGSAEVFRDNAAQTALPSVVEARDLERANGQIWSAEQVMGSFVGPPVAGLLIALAVPAPFMVDAVTFALAAWLVWAIRVQAPRLPPPTGGFMAQLAEGAQWMRRNRAMLALAVMLCPLNFANALVLTVLVLVSQEIYGLSAAGYGLLLSAEAAGGVAGALIGPSVVARLGAHRTVVTALCVFPVAFGILAVTSSALVAGLALAVSMAAGVLWNVVTVSLRQRVIPTALFGRVNSIYRFFGWGSIPLGAVAAGAIVAGFEGDLGRIAALRLPYWSATVITAGLLAWAALRMRLPTPE
ncbi:MFS transporter [Pseudaestuariivita atlantica]|nr:MFS transporter [Pseudaestuariivita atlantica]